MPARLLHRAPEADLLQHLRDTEDTRAALQIIGEINRRDERHELREAREEARRARWAANRMEREAIREDAFIEAETATNGYMLNRRGLAMGIDNRSLFRGPESRARKYASEELLEHWQTHPRRTEAMMAGRDTRVYEKATAPRRRGRRAA